jgi:hypothetical protein
MGSERGRNEGYYGKNYFVLKMELNCDEKSLACFECELIRVSGSRGMFRLKKADCGME